MNKLSIVCVAHKGDPKNECIVLAVVDNILDLSRYIVCDTTFKQGVPSNELRHMFWFPKKAAKKGDFIHVRTGVGTDSQGSNASNTVTHTFYWNLGHSVWNMSGDKAFVFKIEDFKTQAV